MGFINFIAKVEEENLEPEQVKAIEYSLYLIL